MTGLSTEKHACIHTYAHTHTHTHRPNTEVGKQEQANGTAQIILTWSRKADR